MTVYFCDSSALIKRYVDEVGSDWFETLLAPDGEHAIFVSAITQIEIASGLARLQREGMLKPLTVINARRAVAYHFKSEYSVVELSAQIIRRAEGLLFAHPLRAYDAVQLASALEIRDSLLVAGRNPLLFVSADRRLLAAAEAEGLVTDDPNAH